MTETPATKPAAVPAFPPGRYGHRRAVRPRRRWMPALLVIALVAALGVVAFRLYRMYGDPTYDAQVITYTEITDSQVMVDFRVTVPVGGSAICVLRARSRDGAEVGRGESRVTAAPGERQVTARHRLATTARPFVGEVIRCRAAG